MYDVVRDDDESLVVGEIDEIAEGGEADGREGTADVSSSSHCWMVFI